VPLLNVDLVEHMARVPVSLKLRGRRSKYILKHAMRGMLPNPILERGKKGFGMPVARWIRGPLKELVMTTLAPDKLRREGFFQPAYVQTLLDDHLAGRRDNRKQIWTLFMFERWYERYAAPAQTSAEPVAAAEHP
jgi:asparagine synthase (glutamine-hydrolysing)